MLSMVDRNSLNKDSKEKARKEGDMDKPRKNTKLVVLKASDRAKVMGNIPKPGCDLKCCHTICTRCR